MFFFKSTSLIFLLPLIVFSSFSFFLKAQVLDFDTKIIIEKDKKIVERTYLIQINNKQSNWLSDIEIPYDLGQKVEILEASVIDSQDHIVRALKKKEIIVRSNPSVNTFYEDQYVQQFHLKWDQYPYKIKYSYRIIYNEFITVSKWFPIVYNNVPTYNGTLTIKMPSDYEVSIYSSPDLTYKNSEKDGIMTHEWQARDLPTYKTEIFSIPIQEQIPSVSVIPKNFTYSIFGSTESWEAFGQWQDKLNEGVDDLPESEKTKIDRLIEGASSKIEIMKILYHYMQDHTRYINISIDVGGLKPYPASYVCEKKYGDCKALTIYMKALLNYVNIPSFYTIIYASANPVKINSNLPSQQFNHVILSVPIGTDTLWLENTSNYLPFNYLGTFTQNRKALMVSGKSSQLVMTPPLGLEDVIENHTYIFGLDENGKGKVSILKSLKGDKFEFFKYLQQNATEEKLNEEIEADLNMSHYQLKKSEVLQSSRDDKEIKINAELILTDQLRRIGELKTITPPIISLPQMEKPLDRKSPLRINYPINKKDSILYNLPFLNAYTVEIPETIEIQSKYGFYTQIYRQTNNQILIIRSFQLYRKEYPIEEYQGFYDFIESIKMNLKRSVIILNPIK